MTKKFIITTAATLTGFILFFATPLPDMLFGLLFGGVVPGTEFAIPWFIMFSFYLISLAGVILWIRHRQLYIGSPKLAKAQAEFMAKNAPVKTMNRKKKPAAAAVSKAKSRSRRSYSRA